MDLRHIYSAKIEEKRGRQNGDRWEKVKEGDVGAVWMSSGKYIFGMDKI